LSAPDLDWFRRDRSRAAARAIERRLEVGYQIPGSLDAGRQGEQVVRYRRGGPFLAATVLDQAFHAA
jgi:hypothetical protein